MFMLESAVEFLLQAGKFAILRCSCNLVPVFSSAIKGTVSPDTEVTKLNHFFLEDRLDFFLFFNIIVP
jgi:hypothetical protein